MPRVDWVGWQDGRPWWSFTDGRSSEVPHRLRLGVGEPGCVGHHDDGVRVACRTGDPPLGRQCSTCRRLDTFRPCMICDGFACPRLSMVMRSRCEDLHHLYLADFGETLVKVGTASRGRHDSRLVEQGPLAACRIAAGSGPRIKQMEHLLSTRTPLVEAKRRSRKVALLSGGPDLAQAERRVEEAARLAVEVLSDLYADELHPPEWFEPPALAVASRDLARGRTAIPVRTGALVEGEVVGAVGPILLLDDADARFLFDLGSLVGRAVDLDPPGTLRRSTVQLGLFS